MKKSLYIIITVLLILSAFSACTSSEADGTKSEVSTSLTSESVDTTTVSTTDGTSVNTEKAVDITFSGDLTIKKEGEGAEIGGSFESIVSLLNDGTWTKGTPENDFLYTFGINDKTIKYDDKGGVFYNENDSQYMSISEDDKKSLNDTLGMIFERIYEDW